MVEAFCQSRVKEESPVAEVVKVAQAEVQALARDSDQVAPVDRGLYSPQYPQSRVQSFQRNSWFSPFVKCPGYFHLTDEAVTRAS
jgi:hypothetical protein